MIAVEQLSVHAGQFAIRDVSFEVASGQYAILMGRTGSGKTTLLEALTGLKRISSGRILLGSVDVTRLKPAERNIGYVPQDGALFPTMSVRQNLGFALTIRGWSWRQEKERVEELSKLLEIGHLLDRSPRGLSGGERQRVALGRALAFRPETLCLDEPLSALDHHTREQIMGLLKRVQRETGVTVIHVTHGIQEAQALGEVVLRMTSGQLVVEPPARPEGSSP